MMVLSDLKGVADAVVRRAQRQGSLSPDDLKDELTRAGLPDESWEDVLSMCRRSLRHRQGRYHFTPARGRSEAEKQQLTLRRTVRQLIRRHKQAQRLDRRGQGRLDFIQPVTVMTEDLRKLNLLSRDLSTTGIRLIASRSLLGNKLRVTLGEGAEACTLPVRILWACAVGDNLFENGGMFLETAEDETN
jgi:hypothetical protein